MATGPIIQVFNRTGRQLLATKDGRQYPIPPGYSHQTSDIVLYARNQNPVPGSEDPHTLAFESLISRVAGPDEKQVDPLDEIPEDVLESLPKERLDRSKLGPDRQGAEEMATRHFPRGRVGAEAVTEGMIDAGRFQ